MPLRFPDSADSADLAAAGYSQVIILGGGNDSVSTSVTADYLILAGGGGGGGTLDGGGGAGGYRTSWGTGTDGSGGYSGGNSSLETALTLNNGTAYSITVGQGGEGGFGWTGGVNVVQEGHVGRTTSISGSDITTVTTVGGGGGSYHGSNSSGTTGGSGGGGGITHTPGSGTTGQGTNGGAGATVNSDTVGSGGGGGGASTGGSAGGSTLGGNGGDGLASTITGISITRAGGGGGGHRSAGNSTTSSSGGDGGGGSGGWLSSTPTSWNDTPNTSVATHGRAKYGGGGGGGGYSATFNSLNGGNGGSGIAIFRLPSTLSYSASQLASDVSNDSNCTASYLNTQVYTDDTDYSNVILQLDGNESTLKDASSYHRSLTFYGTPAQSTSIKKYGAGSIDFGDTNQIIYGEDTEFLFGTNDFTIEGWVYRTSSQISASQNQLFFANYGTWGAGSIFFGFHNSNSGRMAVYIYNQSTSQILADPTQHAASTWVHYALTRNGTTLTLWRDGSSVATTTLTSNLDVTNGTSSGNGLWSVGQQHAGTTSTDWFFRGHIDDFRITKNLARYTNSFTPAENPSSNNATGGDHVISFTVATEDPHDGGATTNDGTATWTPTLSSTIPAPSTTWTIPEGVDSFSIMAIGAGGAAGYSDSTSAGGGGGGGGLAYLNNIAVTQGNNEVVSITVDGGQLGIGADSNGVNGGDASDLTVTMNLSTANPAMNLSGYNINPYGQVYYDSDSDAAGIMFITSTDNDSVQISPFGTFDSVTDGGQILFDVYSDLDHFTIKALAEPNPNATTYDSNHPWLYNPTTTNYTLNSNFILRNIDRFSLSPFDSNHYFESDLSTLDDNFGITDADFLPRPPIGTIDSLDSGAGAFTLFRVMSSIDNLTIGTMPGRSPYIDSNGTLVISSTGDPSDFKGFGPDDLNQILLIKNLTP